MDHPNIGHYLDSFQTSAREHAGAVVELGLIEDRGILQIPNINYPKSLRNLTAEMPPEEISLLKFLDVYNSPQYSNRLLVKIYRGIWMTSAKGYVPCKYRNIPAL